jgi:hypothetical protein
MANVCGGYDISNKDIQEKGCETWHNHLQAIKMKTQSPTSFLSVIGNLSS